MTTFWLLSLSWTANTLFQQRAAVERLRHKTTIDLAGVSFRIATRHIADSHIGIGRFPASTATRLIFGHSAVNLPMMDGNYAVAAVVPA